MGRRRNQHVVPHGTAWAVKAEGGRRATSIHDTQTAALEAAREIAKHQRKALFVHRADGKVRRGANYGRMVLAPRI